MDYVKWAFNLHPGKMPEPTTEIWPIDGKQTYVYREHESKEPETDKQLEELVMYGDMDHQFYDDEEEEAKRKAARKKDIRKFGKEEIYEILGVEIKYIIIKNRWRYRLEKKIKGLKVRNSQEKTLVLPYYKLRKDYIHKKFDKDNHKNESLLLNFYDYENVPDDTRYVEVYNYSKNKSAIFKRPEGLKNINERYWLDIKKHLDSKSDLRKYLEEDGWINTEPDYKYHLKF